MGAGWHQPNASGNANPVKETAQDENLYVKRMQWTAQHGGFHISGFCVSMNMLLPVNAN